jgi:signal transduction histidine kinase
MEYATAIVVEGRQLATLYFGQIFHEAPDLEYFRQQAQDCGFDEDAYLAAIRKVPVMSRERVDSIMEFYAQLAQMLAKSGLDRLRLLEATDKLRQLTAQREQEFEEARKRIGNNIHEELAQYLTALKLQLSSMLTEVGTDNTGIVQRGERMQSLLDETFAVTRKLVASVRPPVLKEGIGAALDWLAAEFSRNTNIRCRFVESQSSRNIDEDRAVALFRIAEESLGKIARYTDIKNVVISLDQVSDACLLEVKANGREFDTTRLRTDCLDTDSMRERVRAHGGKIMIDCQPEEGATVRVSIPFPARASTQGNSARPRKNLRRPGARTSLTKSS